MIFTIGYGLQRRPRLPALKIDELAHTREQLGAVIVDVRARPYSRWRPEMNRPALKKRFGDKYIVLDLGNLDRSLPGRVNPAGLELLRNHGAGQPLPTLPRHHGPLLLMCLEKHPRDCHRHHAVAMQLPPDSVTHLYHDGRQWLGIEAHALQQAIDAGVARGGEPFSSYAQV